MRQAVSPAETTLHHIALNVSLEDFESEKMRLEGLGLKVNATVHEWLFVFARYTSPTQSGVLSLSKGEIRWSLSVTMQVWDKSWTRRNFQQIPGLGGLIYS